MLHTPWNWNNYKNRNDKPRIPDGNKKPERKQSVLRPRLYPV